MSKPDQLHAFLPGPERSTRPIYQAGGHGFDLLRNINASEYLKENGYNVLPSLPDPEAEDLVDTSYHITLNGLHSQVPAIQAMRHLGNRDLEASMSLYHSKRANQLIKHIEANATEPITGIFVSADNLNGLQAAHQRPDLFMNIWMVNPAGIARPQTILRASIGVARAGVRSKFARLRAKPETNFEAGKDIRPKKGREAGVVAPSVALSYQKHLLTELRAKKDAPNVGMSLALGDTMMDPERIINNLLSDDVDLLFITNGIHGIGGDRQTMDAHLALIPRLESAGAERRAGRASQRLIDKVIFAADVPPAKQAAILKMVAKADKARSSAAQ